VVMYKFDNLSTVKFQEKMKPAALKIYQELFPGSKIQDLREDGVKVHVLDKEFGVDALLIMEGGQWLSIQEKYRSNYYYRFKDFTQEYMNGHGTPYESPGEWFKLGAQLYFYGWANEDNTEFIDWILMDIPRYKILVEKSGGIEKMGYLMHNKQHGSASFYTIPLDKLNSAILKRKGEPVI